MSRQKSEFVSSFGSAFEIFQKLATSVHDVGGDDSDLRKLLSDEDLRCKVAELLVTPASLQPNPAYVVTIDPSKTLVQMIEAGKYDYVGSDIKEPSFSFEKPESDVEGGGPYYTTPTEVSLELVRFKKKLPSMEIEDELDRRGLRSATLQEFLALGAKHPELQQEFPLVALGSSRVYPGGFRDAPYLDLDREWRRLTLCWVRPQDGWNERCRFVCVRK